MIKKNLRAKQEHSFWVTNITDKNVSLADLALTVPARRSMNLLDHKHFHYTLEQLQFSASQGSIYNKSNKIKFCNNPPDVIPRPAILVSNQPRYVAPRSNVKIEEKLYDELPNLEQFMSEEKFALEYVDDLLPNNKKFKS